MKPTLALAFIVATSPAWAQQTGISHPPETVVEDAPSMPEGSGTANAQEKPKPSAAIPMQTAQADEEYKPYHPTATLHTRTEAVDPDAGIVTEVPRRPNELPVGTAIHIRLRNEIATDQTQSNTPFAADLDEDVKSEGRVILPAGSTVEGMITHVRGGRRIRGAALIHLQAQTVLLPDGTRMPLHASVMDTDQYADTRVDAEGNIVRKDHVGATLAAMSLATGGAAAAGAVIGGGVGALVGAGVGAGVSTAWWLKQDRQTHLPKESLIIMGLTQPFEIRPAVREPEFSSTAPKQSAADRASAAAPYVAPQSFVPTN